jgi:hypothetical protein
MTTVGCSISLVCLAVVAGGGMARAAEVPLIVAVEVAPGVDIGPTDVREVIASELGVQMIGAGDSTATQVADVLLVAVEAQQVRMTFRAGTVAAVSRSIVAPSDRSGRLRTIGWLAGNLARDQVGPIVATPAHPIEPPPVIFTPPPAVGSAPDAVLAARASSTTDVASHARWSITAGGGPVVSVIPPFGGVQSFEFFRGTAYQIEVQHQAAPGSILVGAALEIGPDQPRHYFGGAAFVGSAWRRRAWYAEGTLGLGVEALEGRTKTVTVTNNSSQLGTVTETKVSTAPVPTLYGRAAGTAGLHLSQSFDLVAQVGAHISTSYQSGSFLSSTIGLRLRLP